MFGKKQETQRTCPEGHVQEESWERCPYCEADKAPLTGKSEGAPATAAEAAEAPPEAPSAPGSGAVVVPKKDAGTRALAGWLVALNGEQEGEDFRIRAGRNVIGKGAKADVVIKDAYLSERHALLEVTEDGTTLADLGSKHGTFINGKRIEAERPLRDGDRLRVGHTDLKFRSFAV